MKMRLNMALLTLALGLGCGGGRVPLPAPSHPLSTHRALPPAPPPTAPATVLTLPDVSSFVLPSGVEVHVVTRAASPMGEVALLANGGALGDSRRVEDDVVLVDLLQHTLDAEAGIDERGLFVHAPEAGASAITRAAALLRFMREHTFARRDVDRVIHAETEERVTRRSRFVNDIEAELRRRFYGTSPHTTWSNPQRRVEVVRAETVNARLRQLASPAHVTLVIVSAFDAALVESALRALTSDWAPAEHAAARRLAAPSFPPANPQAVGYGGSGEMGQITLLEAGPSSFTSDHPAYRVAIRILGGMYSSRPNAILREERRESYGAHAVVREEGGYATARFYVSVRMDQINAALALLTGELVRLGQPEALSDDEVERARTLEMAAEQHRFDDASTAALAILNARASGTTLDAYAERFNRLRSVRRADVARAAQAWIRPTRAPIVVAGEGTWMATHELSAPGGYERRVH